MATEMCKGCNRMTNSTTSDMWFTPDRKPTKCTVAIENNRWVKGCAYDKAKGFEKDFADSILKRNDKKDSK